MKQSFQPQKYIIFSNWQRKRIYFAAKNRRRQIRASGLRFPSILHQLLGRQKKWPPITAAIYSMIKL
jgi:hypothetical protein